MSQTINQIQDELIEEFELFDDWEGRYEYLIDLGKKLNSYPENKKDDDHIIKGCQSLVWLDAEFKDNKLIFLGDSEAIIVRGLISMLIRVLSEQSPKDILEAELYFIDKIGMSSHLAQTRSNGLASMVKQMKAYALAHLK